jgi:hypothetical protein
MNWLQVAIDVANALKANPNTLGSRVQLRTCLSKVAFHQEDISLSGRDFLSLLGVFRAFSEQRYGNALL